VGAEAALTSDHDVAFGFRVPAHRDRL
jgi:hypothetical protein